MHFLVVLYLGLNIPKHGRLLCEEAQPWKADQHIGFNFGGVSDETLLQMRTGDGKENTAWATPMWLRDVSDHRSEKGLKISFACCSAEELATFLGKRHAEVKPKKGTGCEYRKSSYLPARSATKRHL